MGSGTCRLFYFYITRSRAEFVCDGGGSDLFNSASNVGLHFQEAVATMKVKPKDEAFGVSGANFLNLSNEEQSYMAMVFVVENTIFRLYYVLMTIFGGIMGTQEPFHIYFINRLSDWFLAHA